jgi:N-glycosylase/DNA lyase
MGKIDYDKVMKSITNTEQLIGAFKILSIMIDTFGTVRKSELSKLANMISYRLSEKGAIKRLTE